MAVGGGGEGREAVGAVATAVEKGWTEVKARIGFRVRRPRLIRWRIVMAAAVLPVAVAMEVPVVDFLFCDD